MAATIDLTSSSSNLVSYLYSWQNGFTNNYGSFWNATDGIVTVPDDTATYDQWGAGTSGSNGIVMDGEMQYASQGNLTGDVDTITLGTGYSESTSGGISVSSELVITNDASFDTSGALDALDYAIYGLTVLGSTSYLFDYLAEVGTVINDTAASDVLTGFDGADTFVFSGGNDTVVASPDGSTSGYQDGTDLLDVSAWGVTSFASLGITDLGYAAQVAFGSDSIVLVGTDYTDLDASDFLLA